MDFDRPQKLDDAPLAELLTVLFRQFKRLLAEQRVAITDDEIKALAGAVVEQKSPSEKALAAREALVALVAESEHALMQWNLTFDDALKTEMNAISGWETTAEFLEIANEKSNAELRIAAGATLVAALGDLRYVDHMLAAIAHDPGEIETVTARRVLLMISGVNGDSDDWFDQLREWAAKSGGR